MTPKREVDHITPIELHKMHDNVRHDTCSLCQAEKDYDVAAPTPSREEAQRPEPGGHNIRLPYVTVDQYLRLLDLVSSNAVSKSDRELYTNLEQNWRYR